LGLSKPILYIHYPDGSVSSGIAWEGLISVNETPGGSETTNLWLSNVEYAQLLAPQTYAGKMEAYSWPIRFNRCIGVSEPSPGYLINRQYRYRFSLCYRTEVFNDAEGNTGYLLHFLYNLSASASERPSTTINQNPEAVTFSWDISSIPLSVRSCLEKRPVSKVVLDSRRIGDVYLDALNAILYEEGRFIDPCELFDLTELYPPDAPWPDPCDALIGIASVPEGETLVIPEECTLSTSQAFPVGGTLVVEGTFNASLTG
jgi:hypothetical protein